MSVSALLRSADAHDIAADYASGRRRFDEFLNSDGRVRPHWRGVASELSSIDADEYGRRLASARRMVRENGVTYNVYDDAGGEARPWELDILPLVIDAVEWRSLEAAIAQRAQLSNALLADIYGEQRLIRERVLPVHLVEGHPQFLRPLIGTQPPGGVRVHLYSADLGRRADGSWAVLAERIDAPSGMGYALENRIVVSQTFPELFRDCRVQRLAAFFNGLRESVLGLAGHARPRAVLLTPGPYNEAYFEHAYLARYLGLTLVEGEDLAVRESGVYLKTLAGLERVDVVFRRVDSDFGDPLELRPDSALGVPGLVEAARTGKVVIANALGGGVAECPALEAVKPALCRALLNEDLKLAGAPTLWCGEENGAARALADIDRMVFRDAFDARPLFARGSSAKMGAEMDATARERLRDRIARRGATVTAQEIVDLATAPVVEDGRLRPRPVMLRVFAAWTPNGYAVMPGGLTRVAREDGPRALTMQSGTTSKDTWVLADGIVDRFSLLKSKSETLSIRRVGDEAPSRAMDNLFWLGRYAERAEDLVRSSRAVVLRLGDDAAIGAAGAASDLARRLLLPLALVGQPAVEAAAAGDVAPLTGELHALIFRTDQPRNLQSLLRAVHHSAWSVRDRLSVDTWRTLLAFVSGETLPGDDAAPDPAGARTYLDALIRSSAALAGLGAENMTRGRNWLFLDLGRRIERGLNLARLVRQTLGSADGSEDEPIQLALEIADSAMTYRYRYLGVFQPAPAIDLLLLDETNPRSVAFQAATLRTHVRELPRANALQARGLDKEFADAVAARLRTAEPGRLAQIGANGKRESLLELLDFVEGALEKLSDALTEVYFRHSQPRRAGSAPRRERR